MKSAPTSATLSTCLPACLCLASMIAGCGELPAPAPPAPAAAPARQATSTTQPPPTAAASAGERSSGTKWVGDIPYDVFYDQPLVIAADSTTLAPSISTPTTPAPAATTPEMSPESASEPAPAVSEASATGLDWAQLVSVDVLNEAVTKLRNQLTTNLNTLATYNRNIEPIANDGACLAALAAVAEVHPEAVSWKDNARYVRDLGYEVYQNADGTGREPFDATKQPFEQIVAILNGGPPPDITSQDQVPFADIADRNELMKRIKQSYDFLRAEINTEARFKESPEDIVREASVLASFGGIISTDSYDSADEEKYQQFVRNFMQANIDVANAARADDFAGFESARNRIQQACDACHGEYAFGSEGF